MSSRNDLIKDIFGKEIDIVKNFDIYKYWQRDVDPYIKGIPFVFFTTPVMNLSRENYDRDGYFSFMCGNYPGLYSSLTNTAIVNIETINGDSDISLSNNSPFIKILTNSFKGLEGKDLSSKTLEMSETFYGFKQVLPGPYVDSITGGTLSVRFSDSKNLHIIHLHKLWMDYIEYVSRGFFIPCEDIKRNNEIDYVSTLYYFVLDYDLSTILYYSRYVGVAPILNPYSSLVASIGESIDIPEITIEYSYSYKQDLTPEILLDFNRINQHSYSTLRGYNNISANYDFDEASRKSSSSLKDYDGNNAKLKQETIDDIRKSGYKGAKIIKVEAKSSSSIEAKYIYKLVFTNQIDDNLGGGIGNEYFEIK